MIGNRKFKVVVMTYLLLAVVIIVSMFAGGENGGVVFTGDNIINLSFLIAGIGGMFFGANVGEHFAEAKKTNGTK